MDKSISQTIDRAINNHLWGGLELKAPDTFKMSCLAIDGACNYKSRPYNEVLCFLRSLGLSTSSRKEFSEFKQPEKKQYARALWLTWASMIAREEKRQYS